MFYFFFLLESVHADASAGKRAREQPAWARRRLSRAAEQASASGEAASVSAGRGHGSCREGCVSAGGEFSGLMVRLPRVR